MDTVERTKRYKAPMQRDNKTQVVTVLLRADEVKALNEAVEAGKRSEFVRRMVRRELGLADGGDERRAS